MKTGKKILSIVLALVMLTTMVTSTFYASACNSNNHDPYKEAATVLDTLDDKLDAYDVDLTKTLDGMLNSGDLIAQINDFLSEDNLNNLLSEQDFLKYLESGKWLVELGDEKIAEILEQYLNTETLDASLKGVIEAALKGVIENLPDLAYLDALFPTISSLDKAIDNAIGDYLDGEKLVQLLDKLVAEAIEGKLVYDENGRKILKGLDGDLAASLDKMIEDAIGKYVNDGTELLKIGDEAVMNLLNETEVLGVPVMQLRYVQTLDTLVKEIVLSDNSDIMKTAADALSGIFPNVQPNYDSIVSCLIPILSTLNIDDIVANISNIAGYVQLASPSAFAYLAGINDPSLDADYMSKVNANLATGGYTGSPVEPIVSLSAEKQSKLLEYVAMEKAGEDLADIAAAGFAWSDYTDGANNLDVANALVKMALGDVSKLGGLASDPSLGRGLINLLCDLLNDLQRAPVSTLLKKLSDAEGLAAIADFAIGLLSGEGDPDFKSYDLYFFQSIYYDGEGNPTFYDALVEDPETGAQKMVYTGPQALSIYIPVITAALDFTGGLSDKLDANGGDLIKTLTIDKLPQLINLIKALVSYTDGNGEEQVGLIGYLLDDYKSYLLANNEVMSMDVLISIAAAAIAVAEQGIAAENAKIAIWENYLEQAKQNSDAQKLAMAKHLGILDDSVTEYSDEAVTAAIEQKKQTITADMVTLSGEIEADAAALETLRGEATAAQATLTKFEKFFKDITKDDLYDAICEIFDDEDISLLDALRNDYEDYVDDNLGAGKFNELATLIIDNYDDYEGDGDSFIDDLVKKKTGGEGLGLTAYRNTLIANNNNAAQAVTDAETALQDKQDLYDDLSDQLTELDSGAIQAQIDASGDSATIHISDSTLKIEGDFTVAVIEERINNIKTIEIAKYEEAILAENAKIADYTAEKNENQGVVDSYDLAGLALEQDAIRNLADALGVFIGGDDNTTSLYDYLEAEQPIEMLVAPDRVNALKTIVDTLISLFGDKIGSGGEYTTRLWDIEDKLFGDEGILSTLYNDFIDDPVLSIASRIKPIAEIVDIVYDMGFLRDMIDQYKPLIDAVADIFGDDNEGFIALWKQAYADGTANHHYVNAILSLLPKIVEIYDQVKNIDAVKDVIAPYQGIIDFVLEFLSKDFYDDIMEDGFVETILEDENLLELKNVILSAIDAVGPENKDQIKALVETVFEQVLDGLYQDFLVDPVVAIAKRIGRIADLVKPVTDMFGVDISAYEGLIDDVKAVFDDNFTKDWKKSKLVALVNRISPIADLLTDALDVVSTLPDDTKQSIINMIPEDIRAKLPANILDVASDLLKNVLAGVKTLATDLVKDYRHSPMTCIAKRVPVIVDMINGLIADDDLLNLVFDLIRDVEIGEDGAKLGDYEKLAKRVIADFKDCIGPVLKDTINEDLINTYKSDKLEGVLELAGGVLEIVKNITGDTELIDEAFKLDAIKNVQLTDELTLGDISDAVKLIVAMIPDLLKGIDAKELVQNITEKPSETIIALCGVAADAIDKLLATDNEFINQYTDPLQNTLELVRDILGGVSVKGKKIVISFLDTEKPLESLLSTKNIKKLRAALYEVADFLESFENDETDNVADALVSLADAMKNLEGLIERMKKQSLLKTVEELNNFIEDARPALDAIADVEIGGYRIGDFIEVVDSLTAVLDDIGTDADKSLVGSILSRVGKLGDLVETIFSNETICNIKVGDYKIGDFKSLADIVVKILDDDFYEDYQENPLKTIFDRIDYVKALYEWVKDFGLLDSLNLNFYGYDILEAVDILLPIIDKQLYYDFEQSIFKALTSGARIGKIEKALKDIIRYADLFSYSVNEGLCSAISGLCGVLDGLYDSLVLPTSPANGGNKQLSTSRVLVKKLPAIQNMLRSLKPLLGKGKLINLTDIVSDTVKMEKGDILKAIEGIDLVKPYYYGISDVLDVVGENAAKYDWNTFEGIIDALNGVGVELVPALEKALSVSDVEWKDLKLPQPEYAPGGSAESYLVELSGELGEGILTPLVGTLLKAALTIPAIKDMLGEVDAEAVAGLLNDLLEFDFKDNVVEFDAFNTEHLIYTGLNLLLPKTTAA